MNKLNAYQISHSVSGAVLGTFIADSDHAVRGVILDAMAIAAGYKSHADIPAEVRASDDELHVDCAYGTREDLTAQIKNAAAKYRENEEGEPGVLYVQLSRKNGWTAEFSQTENREMEMTRWSTGADVTDLYVAATTEHRDAAFEYAGDILAGWDSDWTDD